LESIFGTQKKPVSKKVVLTYIIPRDEVAFVPYGGYMKDEEERLREQARIRFEDWQQSISKHGIKSTIRIEVGNPIPKIMSIAEEEKVDMIVAGRKREQFWTKVHVGLTYLGSCSSQQRSCP